MLGGSSSKLRYSSPSTSAMQMSSVSNDSRSPMPSGSRARPYRSMSLSFFNDRIEPMLGGSLSREQSTISISWSNRHSPIDSGSSWILCNPFNVNRFNARNAPSVGSCWRLSHHDRRSSCRPISASSAEGSAVSEEHLTMISVSSNASSAISAGSSTTRSSPYSVNCLKARSCRMLAGISVRLEEPPPSETARLSNVVS